MRDRERQLRDAIDRFRSSVSTQDRQNLACSVVSAASRLLEARVRARRANAPMQHLQPDPKIQEMLDRGVPGIVSEFRASEVLEIVGCTE